MTWFFLAVFLSASIPSGAFAQNFSAVPLLPRKLSLSVQMISPRLTLAPRAAVGPALAPRALNGSALPAILAPQAQVSPVSAARNAEQSAPVAADVSAGRIQFDGQDALAAGADPVELAPRSISDPAAPETGPPGRKRVTFVYDAGERADVSNVRLKGSFDKRTGVYDPAWGGGDTLDMRLEGGGRWTKTVDLASDGAQRDWRWGVVLDTPREKDQWAVMDEESLRLEFSDGARESQAYYAPTTYHLMGARKQGDDDLVFRVWAPGAQELSVKIMGPDGREHVYPLKADAEKVWSTALPGLWKKSQGSAYVYRIKTSEGNILERADPYARVMQGKQRGLWHLYVDSETGEEVQPYHFRDAKRPQTPLTGFEIQERQGEKLKEAFLVFKDESGRALDKGALLSRIGLLGSALAGSLRGGDYNDYWGNRVAADGRIAMTYEQGAWIVLVNNPTALVGLRYEFQDGAGRKLAGKNDPWSDHIAPGSGKSSRAAIIEGAHHQWRWDSVPREKDASKFLFYQMHVGSVFGRAKNSRRSTFDDVRRELGYIKELGYNALELLPTRESEDVREWGYGGDNSLAVESAYGFEDEDGRWVSGAEGLKRLIDEAHRLGLNVVGDVVYNHVGGKYDASWRVSETEGRDGLLWEYDGSANSFLNWSPDPKKSDIRNGSWGPLPAYNQRRVSQFFRDHLAYQFADLHFDGVRFDFTEPIKGTGAGGAAGWLMLRHMTRLARHLNRHAFTAAEQFPYDKSLTDEQKRDGTGAGFTSQWYTEFNHRLVREKDPARPSLLQEAARGGKTVIDRFMDMLQRPWGISGWGSAVAPVTNHDEVGGGDRVINTAGLGRVGGLPSRFARAAARFALGMGLASPGMHMIFQGEEFLADNGFKWGNPSTWDLDWSWREPGNHKTKTARDIARRRHFEFTKAAVILRKSSPAFDADAATERVYTHNDHGVLAFTRKKGGEEFFVIGSLHREVWRNYLLSLPEGRWQEVFNSDAEIFGGSNVGNAGATVSGGQARINIPSAGYLIFKKVGP